MFLLSKKTTDDLSIIKEPFAQEHIVRVTANLDKSFFTNKMEARGYVEFKHGNTEGKQNFKDDTYDGLLLQISSFIKTLK